MRIFQTILHDGDVEALLQRMQALSDVVDVFVVGEAACGSDGTPRPLTLRARWAELAEFHRRLRYVVIADEAPAVATARERSRAQHNGLMRGLLDAEDEDWILSSSPRSLPLASAVRVLRQRIGLMPCVVPEQEHGPGQTVALTFAILKEAGFPDPGEDDPPTAIAISPVAATPPLSGGEGPMVICPYVHDDDRARVVEAFGLETDRGRHLPFHLWKDTQLIGPERAFETCWNAFPDRDVIIVHPDMRPLPDDVSNAWYDRLAAAAQALPEAGLIGCDLLYPVRHASGEWYVQCAGGVIENGAISHIGGFVDLAACRGGPGATRYDDRFAQPRRVDWVTFGGVYIRREVIDMVGGFDAGYRWAYVMDVDYSLEATLCGVRLYQVPVNLLHEENGTTRDFLSDPERLAKIRYNQTYFHEKWCDRLPRLEGRHVQAHPSFRSREGRDDRLSKLLLAEARARGAEFEVAAFVRALAASTPVTDTDVARAYELVLGRPADATGLAWWASRRADHAISGETLVGELYASPEYAARWEVT